jgi:putative Holliday junction resolvase
MRALALDVGSKTIGVAISDEGRLIATACHTWARRGHVDDAKEIGRVVQERAVDHVVVGLPLELDGREGRRARLVREFMAVLRTQLDTHAGAIAMTAWDERFSTAAAERTLLEADMSRARRKSHIDAMAAQFILQGWLDAQPRERAEPYP